MSNKQNILFRADSSSSIGIGHIMRDLVLAKQFKNGNIYFASQELAGNIIEQIPHQVIKLSTNGIEELDRLIKELNIDMIIIDHYGIDYKFEEQLKTQNPKLKIFSLDDTYEKHCCDILLNHNICADEKRYKGLVPPHCELRCGSKYTLIRDEFVEEKSIKRDKIYDIFLAMGGADTAGLNVPILKTVPSYLQICVLTTSANKNLQELEEYVKNEPNIKLHINSNEVAKLLNQSRLAIITPSVIVHELLFMEVPFLAIKTASNQDDMYRYLEKNTYRVMDGFNENCSVEIEQMIKNEVKNVELINFTDLSAKEKKSVLEWRNHAEIKKWMYNQNDISWQEHLNFIDFLRSCDSKRYLVVKSNDIYFGVIDFIDIDFIKKEAFFGIYANPFEKLHGMGKTLLQSGIKYAFDILKLEKLKLEVFADNEKALHLYKKYGFKESGTKMIGKKNIICMEQLYENRKF